MVTIVTSGYYGYQGFTLQDSGYYLRVDVAGVVTIQGGCVTVLRHLDIAWGQGRLKL